MTYDFISICLSFVNLFGNKDMFIVLCVKKHSQTVYIHMKLAANTKIFFHV